MRFSLISTLLIAALLALFIQGCGDDAPEEPQATEPEPLYFEPIGYGQSGRLQDTTEIVIRSPEEWATYRDSLKPVAPFDSVDFSQAVVLLAALPQTTSGYSIEFQSVDQGDSVVTADYVVNIPGGDCLTASALTVPFQAVLVRRTESPVRFTHHPEEYQCTTGRRR